MTIIQVDPGELHVPPTRSQGADPGKLARQLAKFGTSVIGMPPLFLVRGKDGHFRINDGVTRATRVAKLLPGQTVPAIVIHDLPKLDVTRLPRIKDLVAMTNSTREQLLKAVEDMSRRFPEWRFGQLVANAAGWADVDLWDVEDDQLLEAIRKQKEYQTKNG